MATATDALHVADNDLNAALQVEYKYFGKARKEFERKFGQIIEQERTDRGWTAEEAAKRALVAPKTWQRLEDGLSVRNLTFSKVDKLFGLESGTTLRCWQQEDDLAVALRGSREHKVEMVSDEESTASMLINMRKRKSDKTLITQTVTLLTNYVDDPRVRQALSGLVPLAFAGIVNGWDIYDEKGNLTIPLSDLSKYQEATEKKDG